jgi:hypothetical protein
MCPGCGLRLKSTDRGLVKRYFERPLPGGGVMEAGGDFLKVIYKLNRLGIIPESSSTVHLPGLRIKTGEFVGSTRGLG